MIYMYSSHARSTRPCLANARTVHPFKWKSPALNAALQSLESSGHVQARTGLATACRESQFLIFRGNTPNNYFHNLHVVLPVDLQVAQYYCGQCISVYTILKWARAARVLTAGADMATHADHACPMVVVVFAYSCPVRGSPVHV